MNTVLLASALLIGGLLTVQASANLQLTQAVGTPYGASTLQLWIAAALLALLAAATGGLGALAGVPHVPAWYLLAGLASPLYITSGILLFPRLGALVAGGLFVAGQVLASVVLDLTGWLGVPHRPLGAGIVAGAAAVLVGIAVVVRGQRAASSSGGPTAGVPWLVLGLVAGAALPVQGAVNARLRAALHQPITVALVSFLVAAVTISVVLVVLLALRRTPTPRWPSTALPSSTMPWWGWLGAACAAAYVTGTFLLIPAIGAAVTVALTVTGQQLVSALVDARGWFRLPRRPFGLARGTGLGLLVVGALLVQLA